MPRPRALVALALLATVLAGCSGIPTSGGVDEWPIPEEAAPDLRPLPDRPQPGASEEELIAGFLRAGSSAPNDYEVARSYLSDGFRDEWIADAGVTIQSVGRGTERVDDDTLVYTLTSSATVDAAGRFSEQLTASEVELEFDFERDDDGELRISRAPAGIVLTEALFDTVFESYRLWYFDPSFRFLVPDVRYIADRASVDVQAQVLVAALLEPASDWLQGAVVTEFPQGTAAGTVTVASGEATVDLSDEAVASGQVQRQRMRQQLAATLSSAFSQVASVVMTSDGITIPVPPGTGGDAGEPPRVDSDPLVLRAGAFGFGTADGVARLPELSDGIEGLAPVSAVLDAGAGRAAVLGSGGAALVRAGQEPLLVDARAAQVAPSLDPFGFVWSASREPGSAIIATGADAVPHPVASVLPTDARIVSLDVSRDGTRLLLYYSSDAGPRLVVAGIARDDEVPVRLAGPPLELPVAPLAPLDSAWSGTSSVVALATGADGPQLASFDVGGPSRPLGAVPGATTVTGGNGGVDGVLVLADGEVLRRQTSGWQRTGITASLLGTQQ